MKTVTVAEAYSTRAIGGPTYRHEGHSVKGIRLYNRVEDVYLVSYGDHTFFALGNAPLEVIEPEPRNVVTTGDLLIAIEGLETELIAAYAEIARLTDENTDLHNAVLLKSKIIARLLLPGNLIYE